MQNLQNKIVLITGGSTGVGYSIAEKMVQKGAIAVLTARDESKLKTACNQLGKRAHYWGCDVSDRVRVKELIDWVVETFGRIDILVNGAGTNTLNRPIAQMPPEEWDRIFGVNATGTYNVVYYVLPHMRVQKSGLVISISSVAGSVPSSRGGFAYSASKHAMTVLTKIIAQEEMKHGIRSTVISPGRINTPFLEMVPEEITAEYREKILQPGDVAKAVMHIAQLPSHVHVPEYFIMPATGD
ncbi:SDR family NAD(P)-dependent oxidoreductase [candidate division KSB1 bacterium]|nr:SDR family NAD(P)-dependent oxidoreductase [candidate division KSB1 bacterium]